MCSSDLEISDSFCRNLWDRNGGNQKIFDGRILLGTSPLSGISHAQMQDLQSLLASRTRLPEDLQERAADTLNKLENALKRETKGAAWKREVSDLLREFHRAEEDTASSRARTRFPKGPRGAEEEFQVHRIQAELYDQVLRAKYAEHPNWKRVEELFPQAKEDLLKAIETLPVSQEKKQRMLERVSGVRLSLPSRNPESVGANEECESTAKGAYYFPSINKIGRAHV